MLPSGTKAGVAAVPNLLVPDVAELRALGRANGLDRVGVATAEPFASTRRILDDRKQQGLHGGMAFTYRSPARSTTPTEALPGARSLVVGARSYRRGEPATASEGAPTAAVARYAWEDHYGPLRTGLGAMADRLRAEGWRARVLADDNALVDRAAAQRAGLGWFGKNANLLLPGQGSWFVLGAVVTDAPLTGQQGSPEAVPDGCGTCHRCLDGCPTGAIVAPGVVDARRCLAWLLQAVGSFPPEHRVALGDRIYGCDDCQEVCPPNRRVVRHDHESDHGEAAADPPDGSRVDLLAMLEASDDELLDRHGRWYIPRREPRFLRRNALVVLGNVGDPDDVMVVQALARALASDDPLLRGHAVWAARRLGRTDLLVGIDRDPDPFVQEELHQSGGGADLSHLLVTNDFPPKVGGIQSLLWEWWRRLDPTTFTVLTTPYEGAADWDAEQAFPVHRTRQKILWPTPALVRQVDRLATEADAGLVLLDPALPVGLIGPHLARPYGVVLHGAEITVPGRLPLGRQALRRVLVSAREVIAAGGYPAAEAERAAGRSLPTTVVSPGVDVDRFRPLDADQRRAARARLGLPVEGRLVVSLSRLVPRKGMDVLIEAAAQLAPTRPDLVVAIAGSGRDRSRLERLVERTGAPVRLLGRIPEEDKPALYGAADVFAMLCRNRWAGLEQEGFGIVFLEAAACGVPQVAGDSGGAAEAVADGETGLVVRNPDDPGVVVQALAPLLDDDTLRRRMGAAARVRAVQEFSYEVLADRLGKVLARW